MADSAEDFDALLRRALDGDQSAFRQIYDGIERHVRAQARLALFGRQAIGAYALEDIVQESLMKMWRSLSSHQEMPALFADWLSVLVRNVVRDLLRRSAREPNTIPLAELVDEPADPKSLNPQLILLAARLHEAMAKQLTLEEQDVVRLRIHVQLPYSEIATAKGLTVRQAKYMLKKALAKLRKELLE